MATEADDSDSGFRSVTPSEDREEYKRMFSFFERISSHSQPQTKYEQRRRKQRNRVLLEFWWYSYHQGLWCLECSRRFLLETERLSDNDQHNRVINSTSKNPNTKNKRGILAFISQMSSPQ